MNIFQRHKDFNKTMKVIHSCTTFNHTRCACRMVDNFYKKYGYCRHWRILDEYARSRFISWLDYFQYVGDAP